MALQYNQLLQRQIEQDRQSGLGSSLAQGLGNAVGGLVQGKIGQMQRQNLEQQLTRAGIAPEDIALLQSYPPEIQAKLLSQLWQRGAPAGNQPTNGQPITPGQPGQQLQQSKLYQPPREEVRKEKQLALQQETVDIRRQEQQQRREAQFEKNPRFSQIRTRASIVPEIKKDVESALDTLKETSLTGPVGGKFAWASPEGQKLKAKLDSVAIQKYLTQLTPGSKGSIALLELIQASKANTKMNYSTIKSLLGDVFDDATRYGYEQQALNFAIEDGYSQAKANDLVDNVARISKRLPDLNEYEDGEWTEENGYYFQKMNDEWVFKGYKGKE